ncbi:MAG: hypothetical protein RLZZ70_583 [Candidatus Parcubacteria bacterium]|jgi:DNA helicase-2/ATP-dependent DNA helicase PcrA
MTTPPYLAGLNDAQARAVTSINGPLLVLAGAGSGKTRVITHRIVHLIHEGVAPQHILAVTFTNKAAKEMRERVHALISKYASTMSDQGHFSPTVTTFHALGVRLLREHHDTLGLSRHFIIHDRSDSVRAVKQALEKANYNPKEFEPRKILSKISRAKGDAITCEQFKANATTYPDRVAAEVWAHYETIIAAEHALDFDDLLVKTLALLRDYPYVCDTLTKRYQYIHIDEYQDTNRVQFEIARLLAGQAHNICVVGDIDQNIYSWRGADIKNVLQFEKHFPNTTTVLLEENYRSTQTIIEASNQIIAKNKNRVAKEVFTNNDAGEKITLYSAMSGGEEAEYIARTAQSLINTGTKASSIAVLYRTNFQSRALEEAFLNYGVDYQMLGTKFYERKEIKDVVSYLRLALNPGSTGDLVRIINEPARGIGKVTLEKVLSGNRSELKGAVLEKIQRFDDIMMDIAAEARTKPLSEALKFIIKRTGIETELKKQGTEEDLSRLENLRELVTIGSRFDDMDREEAVEAFMETAALQSDQDELKDPSEEDAVRLMTIHASKGLEFPYIFISGLEEGLFPHERLDDTGIDHEEERRLFYVALTRAEKKLYLTYAHMRTIYGSQKINVPSSFLNDISKDLVESANPKGWGNTSSGYETTIFLD